MCKSHSSKYLNSVYISNAGNIKYIYMEALKGTGSIPFGQHGIGCQAWVWSSRYRPAPPSRHFVVVWWVRRRGGPTSLRYKNRSFISINTPVPTNSTRVRWGHHHHTYAIIPACQLPYITRITPPLGVDAFPAKLPKVIPQLIPTALWLISRDRVFGQPSPNPATVSNSVVTPTTTKTLCRC